MRKCEAPSILVPVQVLVSVSAPLRLDEAVGLELHHSTPLLKPDKLNLNMILAVLLIAVLLYQHILT